MKEESEKIKVLVVEDNDIDARVLDKLAHKASIGGMDLHRVKSFKEATEALREGGRHYDVMLVDPGLPDASDLDAVLGLQADAPQVPIVVITGERSMQRANGSVEIGAQDCLFKGEVSPDGLMRTLGYAIKRHRMRRDVWAKIDRLRLRSQRLFQLSHLDPLTKLPNRRGFQRQFYLEKRVSRAEGRPLQVISVVLERLQDLNEIYGIDAGDLALSTAAQVLREAVAERGIAGRLGGARFMALVRGHSLAEAEQLAARLQRSLGTLSLSLKGRPLPKLSASASAAEVPDKELRVSALMRLCEHRIEDRLQASMA